MNILIINREHPVELKYISDCDKIVNALLDDNDTLHVQQITKIGNYVTIKTHDEIIKNLKPNLKHIDDHPSGNPF